jgi:hypothetical protein
MQKRQPDFSAIGSKFKPDFSLYPRNLSSLFLSYYIFIMESDMIRLYFRYTHDPDQMVSLEVPSEILVDDIRPILHDMEGLECSISQVIIFSPDGEHIDHDATVHDVISEIYGHDDSLQLEPLFIKILDIDELADHGDNMWKISSRINKLHIK